MCTLSLHHDALEVCRSDTGVAKKRYARQEKIANTKRRERKILDKMYSKQQWQEKQKYWQWQLKVAKSEKRKSDIKALLEIIKNILKTIKS